MQVVSKLVLSIADNHVALAKETNTTESHRFATLICFYLEPDTDPFSDMLLSTTNCCDLHINATPCLERRIDIPCLGRRINVNSLLYYF